MVSFFKIDLLNFVGNLLRDLFLRDAIAIFGVV